MIEPQLVVEGAGVLLRRSVSPRASNEYDPFLLFDHFAFNNPLEGPIRGFPMHPHRGIETVTYILDGSVNHRDSLGNAGTIGPGDVQWMTSGRGILHEEMPKRGSSGNIYGFQLWVNLPAAQKMGQPRYQEVNSSTIPVVEKDGATIRLVGHTALAYVFEGVGEFSGEVVESVSMVVFNDDGDQIEVKSDAASNGVQFMLIAGAPFKESIVPYGPFVMNTVEEIQQTIQEFFIAKTAKIPKNKIKLGAFGMIRGN